MASKKTVKTSVLSELFGIKTRRIQQLISDDHILTGEKIGNEYQCDLYQAVKDYVAYLKRQIENKDDAEVTSLETQKLQADVDLKKAKAKMAQLELMELEGQLHRSEDVENAVTNMAVGIRSLLMSLPGQLAVDVSEAESPAIASSIIKKAIDSVLVELAEYQYDPGVYRANVRERKGLKNRNEVETET